MGSARVPQEIWDRILEVVDSDDGNATLRAYPIPRGAYRIEVVNLRAEHLCRTLSESPHLRAFVTVLAIPVRYLARFLEQHLPNIQDLHLRGVNKPDDCDIPEGVTLAAFPRLLGLHLNAITLLPSRFLALIESAPHINHLGFRSVFWWDRDGESERFPSSPNGAAKPRLTGLEIEERPVADTLEHLAALAVRGYFVLALEQLSLPVGLSEPWFTVSQELPLQHCSMLRSLRITNYEDIRMDSRRPPFDFSDMVYLEEISITMMMQFGTYMEILPHIVSSLETIKSRSFRSLVISILAPGVLLSYCLPDIGSAFTDVGIEQLSELHVRYCRKSPPGGDYTDSDLIREHFGVLMQRGLVVKLFKEAEELLYY
ncbi:hypothetical protein PUNSTDRAFT_141162 [Punctularia strigosozonata HHB-11173 SS5]|uniref:uncharacterized protein n=1 Tax=Punctularia strigosozonata (strain HHB-11173) TaxID=741275 RepID=UPI0004417AEA|nr:uncharacterized protein PUNSTDRAFT_141162 [Punctularia strigosozonata HHB-11173 SS5]EIN12464.1 hypothetical protein PUNSTDRAFT_141162 [Punctularia strigosozonata HHB-11173 SS5]